MLFLIIKDVHVVSWVCRTDGDQLRAVNLQAVFGSLSEISGTFQCVTELHSSSILAIFLSQWETYYNFHIHFYSHPGPDY